MLGCFIEGISIVVLTTSVLMPVIEAAKIDPLVFGSQMAFIVQMGFITPPVGFNLFVIQGLAKCDLQTRPFDKHTARQAPLYPPTLGCSLGRS